MALTECTYSNSLIEAWWRSLQAPGALPAPAGTASRPFAGWWPSTSMRTTASFRTRRCADGHPTRCTLAQKAQRRQNCRRAWPPRGRRASRRILRVVRCVLRSRPQAEDRAGQGTGSGPTLCQAGGGENSREEVRDVVGISPGSSTACFFGRPPAAPLLGGMRGNRPLAVTQPASTRRGLSARSPWRRPRQPPAAGSTLCAS